MKKKQICFLYLLTVLLCSHKIESQISNLYSFSQYTSTYQSITSGTVFGNANSDDVVFVNPTLPLGAPYGAMGPGLEIGFSFLYNNIRYDRVGLCNDGWISFGQSALGINAVNTNVSNIFNAISATSNAAPNLQNRIAILSRDLQAQSGSELRIATIGSSPNRTCVVQWTNYRKYNATGDSFNFQLCLYETSNVIEFKYGSFVNGATSGNAQLGLRGTTNTDYLNRITNTSNPWTASAAGNVNTAVVNFNNTGLVPPLGLIYKWTPPQCSSSLTILSASVNPNFICANASSTIQLINSYTLSGITYTWTEASASAGPYTLVPNTNQPFYQAGPILSTTWYQALSTCLSTGSTVPSFPVHVQVAAPIISTIPYLESFEGLIIDNQLPNCSWLASNMPAVCNTNTSSSTYFRTPYSGTKFASFASGTNPNGDYFYSNGIQLNAGVIYSASVAYITDGNSGWNNFSIAYGSSQTVSGLILLDSVLAPTNTTYASLSHTFIVPSSAVYYLAIKCIASTSPFFLSFDDVKISAPCNLNAPILAINSNTTIICTGRSAILTASGANTYTWSNGVNTAVNTVSPSTTTIYTVTGTHTASACSSILSETIQVKSSPILSIVSNTNTVCKGDSVFLNASGATSYTWSNTQVGQNIAITPLTSGSITVYGENSNGCGTFTSINITVIQPPTMIISSSSPLILCVNETATLTASGAINYQWLGPNLSLFSNPIVIHPLVQTNYTIIGTDASACTSTTNFTQDVSLCEGITSPAFFIENIKVFPNPANEELTIEVKDEQFTSWNLYDKLGTIITSGQITGSTTQISVKALTSGIYFIKLISVHKNIIKKIVKI